MGEWFEIKGQVCRRKTERGDDSPSLPRSHIHVRRFFFPIRYVRLLFFSSCIHRFLCISLFSL